MGKIILKRNTQISDLQSKIYDLQDQCGKLYRASRENGDFDDEKYERLSKEIEWQEYLLWGARNGILQ